MAMNDYHSQCTDVCAEPGGPLLCLYVCLFPCCAAGDVAEAAGRSYLCSCFIAPLLSHMFHHDQSWIEACAWYMDRTALNAKYGINDTLDASGGCISMAYIYFSCGCGPCLLIRECLCGKASRGPSPCTAGAHPTQPPTPPPPFCTILQRN